MFKRISEAYEVLSDQAKRDAYDHRETGSFHFPRGGFTFRSSSDIFREFFGDDDPFSRFFGGPARGSDRYSQQHPRRFRQEQHGGFGQRGGFTQQQEQDDSKFGQDNFGFGQMPSMFGASSGFFSSSFGSSSGGGGFTSFSESTSTSYVNGHEVTKKVTEANGVRTEERYENGRLTRKVVNGVDQNINLLQH